MLRKVLGTVLLWGALAGCTAPLRVCETNADCSGGGVCDLERKLCFSASAEGGACEPACTAAQACTLSNVCVPRYTGIEVTPGDGGVVGAGPVSVEGRLIVGAGFAENFPGTLNFSVVASDGGTGGTLGPVTGSGGVYTTQWTPAGEGDFLLTAAYPEAGGPSTTVRLSVDRTPPAFAVFVPPADAGVPAGGTTYADPSLANAWRRDQVVPVEIRTNEPHLDVGSVTVKLVGTDGGSAPAVAVTPLSGACDAGFCGVAQLKLWEPAFDAFRSSLPIVVQGRDVVGNPSSASSPSSLDVTRWKWVFDASSGGALIKTPTAIGEQGTIYFGTAAGSAGTVFALRPDGTKQWDAGTGAVVSGPAVGVINAGVETVYVGVNTSGSDAALLALNGSTGAERQRCTGSGQVASNMALMQTSGAAIETAVTVLNIGTEGSIRAIRPEASGDKCPSTGPVTLSQVNGDIPGPLIVRESSIFYANENFEVTSYNFGSNSIQLGWPVPTGFSVNGLALVGNDIVGANGGTRNQGAVFSIPTSGDTTAPVGPSWLFPSTPNSRADQPVIGPGNVVSFGSNNLPGNRTGLAAISLGGSDLTDFQAGSGVFRGAPVLGRGGALYAAGTEGTAGTVGAWFSDNRSSLWSVASSSIGPISISPALDCARDGAGAARAENLGVLYVPAGGKLYAFVVDSRGLDTSAPWPKYQHDARNTGNPATPITSCP